MAEAEWLGSITWRSDDPLMGGMSALDLTTDGVSFVALSDRGAVTHGILERDAMGALLGIRAAPLQKLLGRGQAILPKGRADSEGLAVADDGSFYVSFEGATRVLHYVDMQAEPINLPRPDAFKRYSRNASLEALAIASDGSLYTLPEDVKGDFPLWHFAEGVWSQDVFIARQGDFLPVAADFGPDGWLYILERNFQGISGFASRVRRFDPLIGGMGETVMQSRLGQHDNLEGLAVWRDQDGFIRLTMIADDNFRFFQSTEIAEYRLSD
ncbi:esterase-like activity of phytase family protein [Neogemmobacter tilapiae]|uniref:Phytase-like domain-containing protein n=1 Tax=Neogemmobacter tilapiae TaxID=875041 RepID=A0A918WMI9_9RHOB|nr:esterase-like activity of phytase family protein [Gemmobacter tilapiae]GHC57058.1 hypothetical protein GCM10007315_20610 [Gemmobacter tilapiae]